MEKKKMKRGKKILATAALIISLATATASATSFPAPGQRPASAKWQEAAFFQKETVDMLQKRKLTQEQEDTLNAGLADAQHFEKMENWYWAGIAYLSIAQYDYGCLKKAFECAQKEEGEAGKGKFKTYSLPQGLYRGIVEFVNSQSNEKVKIFFQGQDIYIVSKAKVQELGRKIQENIEKENKKLKNSKK